MASRLAATQPQTNAAVWMAAQLEAAEPDFSAIAATLMGLGLAAEAARCHGWSLLPPDEAEWRQALHGWSERIGQRQPDEPVRLKREDTTADTEVELGTIQALMDGGDVLAACERMTRLCHDHVLPAHLCNRAGMLHAALGDHWQAERWYRTSLVQQQGQVQPWFGLADALLKQAAFDEALEAAQVGLGLYPDHPWGLKLQQHALQRLGAGLTLQHLADQGRLPFGFDAQATAENPGFKGSVLPPIGLQDKLMLQQLLQGDPLKLWSIGPGGHVILEWMAQQRLLSHHCNVRVFADPDVDLYGLLSLESTIIQVEQSLPLYRIRQQQERPDFVIITLPIRDTYPCSLGPVLAQQAPLLVDCRLSLQPPQHRVSLSTELWNLWQPRSNL